MYEATMLSHALITDDERLARLLGYMADARSDLRGPASQAFDVDYRVLREATIAALGELDADADGSALVIYKNGRVQAWPSGNHGPSSVRRIVGETFVRE
jgi:hypothetical protein